MGFYPSLVLLFFLSLEIQRKLPSLKCPQQPRLSWVEAGAWNSAQVSHVGCRDQPSAPSLPPPPGCTSRELGSAVEPGQEPGSSEPGSGRPSRHLHGQAERGPRAPLLRLPGSTRTPSRCWAAAAAFFPDGNSSFVDSTVLTQGGDFNASNTAHLCKFISRCQETQGRGPV